MDIYLDNQKLGTVSNGDNFTRLIEVLEGEYIIYAYKAADNETKASIKISVTDNATFSSSIYHGGNIEFKNAQILQGISGASIEMPMITGMVLKDAMQILSEAGFINVKEEPYGSIWDKRNWIVTAQNIGEGMSIDKNELIQLDCISLDEYFNTEYSGKNVLDILACAQKTGFTIRFESNSTKNITDVVMNMNDVSKAALIASKARQYGGAEKTAIVTLPYEEPKTESATPTSTASPKNNNTNTTTENKILTAENNKDLAALLTSEYLSSDNQQAFIRNYRGHIIEFDCFVFFLEQNPKYKTIYSYVLAPGEDSKHLGAALFCLENMSSGDFKWDKSTRPESLTFGSKIRIQAKIVSGSDPLYIYLDPIKTWGR